MAGCADPVDPTEQDGPRSVRQWVVGTALANLDRDGRFVLADRPIPMPEGWITPERAVELSASWISTVLDAVPLPGTGSIVAWAEEQHGAPIPWDDLRPPFRPVYLAASPYQLGPDTPTFVALVFGERYLAPLGYGQQQALALSISVRSTTLDILPDGRLHRIGDGGNEILPAGVPKDLGHAIPPVPEDAVWLVATATGAKIETVPELLLGRYNPHASMVRWKLRLDRAVPLRVTSTGGIVYTREVYIGFAVSETGLRLAWFVSAPDQPDGDVIPYFPTPDSLDHYFLRRRAGAVLEYLEVEPVS